MYYRLPRPLGYTRLPRPLGYTWPPRYTNSYISICIQTAISKMRLYKFIGVAYSRPLFMHQACVFENKYQYDMSNKIMTNVISDAFIKGLIKQPLKDAIDAFQIKLNNKRRYLAFYIRKTIHNCYDAMTTSPCESMISLIKHSLKATTLNNTRGILFLL